jgi:hypothetical protein
MGTVYNTSTWCNYSEVCKQRLYTMIKKWKVTSPIMTRAGTAFHSSQNVMKDDVTNMMPGMKTVVK